MNSSILELDEQYITHSHVMDFISLGTPIVLFPSIFIFVMRYLGRERREQYFRTCTILMNTFINQRSFSPRNTRDENFDNKNVTPTQKYLVG